MSAWNKVATAVLAIAIVTGSALFYQRFHGRIFVEAHQVSYGDAEQVVFASPGIIEGLSDTIEVGAAADGILKTIYVSEGQTVKQDTLMGEIGCDDLNAALQISLADADAARQARARLLRGARDEEKQVAAKKTAATRATLAEARAQLVRQRALYKGGEISRADFDRAYRDFGVAKAEFQAAVRAELLLAAPPLPEDKARADAEVVAAENGVQEAQDRVKKCAILAPIDGTVLRVNARPGESFSTVMPHPLFILADASGRRVKAEVDERDVSKIAIGQKVIVRGEGLTGKSLAGNVESVAPVMGKKNVFTNDPADKIDRDVLEVTIKLPSYDSKLLPIGLRVTVQFLATSRQQ